LNIGFAYAQLDFSDEKSLNKLKSLTKSRFKISSIYWGGSSKTIDVSIDPSDLNLYDIGDYDFIKINDVPSSTEAGQPKLPIKTVKVELPKGSVVSDVKLIEGKYVDILNELDIVPVSQPVRWDKKSQVKKYLKEETAYNTDSLLPGNVLSYDFGKDNEKTILYIRISPLQYNPKQKKAILITDLEIEIKYREQPEERSFIASSSIASSFPVEVENLIITPPEFMNQATQLAEFHNQNGIVTVVIDTDVISTSFGESAEPGINGCSNNDCSQKIENGYNYSLARRIITLLADPNLPSSLEYVTLFGNAVNLPPSYYVFESGYEIPTDFFYSSPDLDLVPNYFVGRLPVNNDDEAAIVVNKIINWHQENGQPWFNDTAIIGGQPFFTPYYYGELITLDSVNKGYINSENLEKYFYTDGKFDEDDVEPLFTDDPVGLAYEIGHGSGDAMYFDEGSPITAEEVMAYTPTTRYPIFVSIACTNGQYDTNIEDRGYSHSFAEALLVSGAGAIAYIGGSRTNYGAPDVYFDQGRLEVGEEPFMAGLLTDVMESYSEGYASIGEVTTRAMEKYIENTNLDYSLDVLTLFEFTLLGDPTLRLPARDTLSYEKPFLTALNPTGWKVYPAGLVPEYRIVEGDSISVDIATDSPSINAKLIDSEEWHYPTIEPLAPTDPMYSFTPNRDTTFLVRAEGQDKKEGWQYLYSQTLVQGSDISVRVEDLNNVVQDTQTEVTLTFSNLGTDDAYDVNYILYEVSGDDEEGTVIIELLDEETSESTEETVGSGGGGSGGSGEGSSVPGTIIAQGILSEILSRETRTFVKQWTPLSAGHHTLRLMTDYEDVNPDNNNYQISVDVISMDPDLDIEDVYLPSQPIVNQSNKLRIEIENEGLQTATDVNLHVYEYSEDIHDYILIEDLDLEDISSVGTTDVMINWTPEKVGYNDLRIFVNCTNESDYSDNTQYNGFYVAGDGPDLTVWTHVREGEYNAIVNEPNDIVLGIENRGSKTATNVNYSIYATNDYVYRYIDYGETSLIEYDGVDYYITPYYIDEQKARINVSYYTISEELILDEGQVDTLSNGYGLFIELRRVYGDSASIYLYNGTKETGTISDMVTGEYLEEEVSWTPTETGEYRLKVFVDTVNETNYGNNYEHTYARVTEHGPDLDVWIDVDELVEEYGDTIVDRTNIIQIYAENRGTARAEDTNYTVYIADNYLSHDITYGDTSSMYYSDTIYNVTPHYISQEEARVTVNYSSITEEFTLFNGQVAELSDGIFIEKVRRMDNYATIYLYNASRRQGDIGALDVRDGIEIETTWTPDRTGNYRVKIFVDTIDEAYYGDNSDTDYVTVDDSLLRILNDVEDFANNFFITEHAGNGSNVCAIIKYGSRSYSFNVDKVEDDIQVSYSLDYYCDGTSQEDIIISYIDYDSFLASKNDPSCSRFKTKGDGTEFHILPSRFVASGGAVTCNEEFQNKYCEAVSQCATETEMELAGLDCCKGVSPKVNRRFSSPIVEGGDNLTVSLDVQFGDSTYYAIDEIPPGWEIVDAGLGDTTEPGHIKWLYIEGFGDITYDYMLAAPQQGGIYSFNGSYMLEGDLTEHIIGGDSEVTVACQYGDRDCNTIISMAELIIYVSRWKADSADVTMPELMQSINYWKTGVMII